MKLNPLHDNVVVRRLDAEEKTSGGLHVPESARKETGRAEVLAVGPGRRTDTGALIQCLTAPGITVVLGRYAGTDVTVDGETLTIVRDTDVLAVLSE